MCHPMRSQRSLIRCTVREKDYESDIILHNLYMVGRIYSIEGKHGYYNLLKFNIGAEAQDTFTTLQSVSIGGVEYPVEQGVFFITPEPVNTSKSASCLWM